MRALVGYGAVLVTFVAIDAVWLGWIARGLYKEKMGPLLTDQPNFVAAAAFYLLYPIGLLVFALWPALAAQSWVDALWRGALLGLIAYATYDLTNLAVLRGFPMSIALIDMAWGATLSAIAVVVAFVVVRAVMPTA